MLNKLEKVVWGSLLTLGLAGLAAWPASAQEAETAARRVTKRVTPTYPLFAQQARLSGTVRLLLVVSPDGTVKSLKTLGGNAVLASAAEIAMKQWKFEPGKNETNESVAFKFDPPK
jgi:TonB family protein